MRQIDGVLGECESRLSVQPSQDVGERIARKQAELQLSELAKACMELAQALGSADYVPR